MITCFALNDVLILVYYNSKNEWEIRGENMLRGI